MKRIVLEVDEQVGKLYQSLSVEKQQQLLEAISSVLKKSSNDATASDYRKTLDEFGNTALRNGLTEDILNGLLKEDEKMVGKSVEVIAFDVLDSDLVRDGKKPTSEEAKSFYSTYQVNMSGYTFNREEANER